MESFSLAMVNKKHFRRMAVEMNRRSYHAALGKESLWINFLINQRSHESCPEYLTRKVANYLQKRGFFNWYPGRHVNGKLIRTAPVDSLMVYSWEALRYNTYRRADYTSPFFGEHNLGHYITILCDNQYQSGYVRMGWCWVEQDHQTVVFKLEEGKWVEHSRLTKDDYDLPF